MTFITTENFERTIRQLQLDVTRIDDTIDDDPTKTLDGIADGDEDDLVEAINNLRKLPRYIIRSTEQVTVPQDCVWTIGTTLRLDGFLRLDGVLAEC